MQFDLNGTFAARVREAARRRALMRAAAAVYAQAATADLHDLSILAREVSDLAGAA